MQQIEYIKAIFLRIRLPDRLSFPETYKVRLAIDKNYNCAL